jgi:DNA polymerase (family X)
MALPADNQLLRGVASKAKGSAPTGALSNAEIADRLMSLAQLLSAQKENTFKVKAYRRAAKKIKTLSESVDELVRRDADLTEYSGIGKAISSAIREIVLSGTLRQLETLLSQVPAELAAITDYPRLDPKRVLRIYKKFNISTIVELKERLESGAITERFGARMDQHVRQALTEAHEMLLYDADSIAHPVEEFLHKKCGVRSAQATGDYRRRVEVVGEISFLIETDNFSAVVEKMERYGGKAELLGSAENSAVFRLSSGTVLRIERADKRKWGLALITSTGSANHLRSLRAAGGNLEELARSDDDYSTEEAVYRQLGLSFIEPELREGHNEVELAMRGGIPTLVSLEDIRGELHAHSTSSDGSNSIEQMAAGARKKGYEYIGISDHSQSLKIAGGVSEEDLWKQIRFIDQLNERIGGIRVLKSAEVDILADGSLDYPDELLKELDYTVCSIHSRFGLGKAAQTERILRAMDNRCFTILGHATGRLLLKRPGYEIDVDRVIDHARTNGCFFEINSSPDRLDLSAENARVAGDAGVKIAINTDAHSVRELDYIRGGVDQARRAGLGKESILNCHSWPELRRVIRR